MIGFDESEQPASDEQVRGAELIFGVRFPAEYRSILLRFGGSHGDVDISVDDKSSDSCSLGVLFSVVPGSAENLFAEMSTWNERGLSSKLIPVGADGGGNHLCLDFRKNAEPTVVFLWHDLDGEDAVMPVASTFKELLGRLSLPEETEDEE